MANTSFLTEKKYLDTTGLQALIRKIADMNKQTNNELDEITKNITDIIARLDKIYVDGDTPTGLLADAINNIAAIRAEIGDPSKKTDKDIYDRLKALEDGAGSLEPRVLALEQKAYINADFDYNTAAGAITLKFYSIAGTPGADGAAGDPTKPVFEKTIKADDFVKNGMIKAVYSVTIGNDGKPYDSSTIPDPANPAEAVIPDGLKDVKVPDDVLTNGKGKKYIVLQFNTSTTGADGAVTAGTTESWLPVDTLFNDYDFDNDNDNEDYITVDVTETNPKPTDPVGTVNKVTISSALGQKAKDDFALVEGEAAIPNSGDKYKGIVALNTAVDANTTDIAALKKTVDGDPAGADDKAKKGLVGRTADLELSVDGDGTDENPGLVNRTTDIENWLNGDGILPASEVRSVFDYIVFGINPGPDLPAWSVSTYNANIVITDNMTGISYSVINVTADPMVGDYVVGTDNKKYKIVKIDAKAKTFDVGVVVKDK